jgi:hypothetical protein
MKNSRLFLAVSLIALLPAIAWGAPKRPKLILTIVIDQFT